MYQIVIADDEVIERTALCKKLRRYYGDTIAVREAENGREVLILQEERPADILILDIEMPGITGLDAAQELRSRGSSCSIIFLTAFDEFSYARKAVSVHATDYLLKPCDDRELLSAVEEGMRLTDERRRRAALDASNAMPGLSQGEAAAAAALTKSCAHAGGQQDKISSIIAREYMHDLSVADMANELGYSEAYFCKLFKQYFGQSFISYLTEYRIREAIRLFANEGASVKDIGQAVGYADSNYFAKVFKRVTGHSPTDYRMSIMHKS